MKCFVSIVIAVCCMATGAFSQSDSKELKAAQKELKKNLIKHTKNVYAVDYSGCEASVKVVSSFSSFTSDSTALPPQGFAGFPSDTSGPTFGGSAFGPASFYRFLLDFAKLDPNKIEIKTGYRKNTSVIRLEAADGTAIRTKKDGKLESTSHFFVTTKTKSASKLAVALKTVIERCSTGN